MHRLDRIDVTSCIDFNMDRFALRIILLYISEKKGSIPYLGTGRDVDFRGKG
jgi:hypothetical protein